MEELLRRRDDEVSHVEEIEIDERAGTRMNKAINRIIENYNLYDFLKIQEPLSQLRSRRGGRLERSDLAAIECANFDFCSVFICLIIYFHYL